MSNQPQVDAHWLQERASHALWLAWNVGDEQARAALVALAESYDRQAREIEADPGDCR
jgi:hypothetical protein